MNRRSFLKSFSLKGLALMLLPFPGLSPKNVKYIHHPPEQSKQTVCIPNEAMQIFCQFENPSLKAEIEKISRKIGLYYGSYDFSSSLRWVSFNAPRPLGYYLFYGEHFSADLMAIGAGSILIIDRNFIKKGLWETFVSCSDEDGWQGSCIILDDMKDWVLPKTSPVYYLNPMEISSMRKIKEIIYLNYHDRLQMFPV